MKIPAKLYTNILFWTVWH